MFDSTAIDRTVYNYLNFPGTDVEKTGNQAFYTFKVFFGEWLININNTTDRGAFSNQNSMFRIIELIEGGSSIDIHVSNI